MKGWTFEQMFQSTPARERATRLVVSLMSPSRCFNPRPLASGRPTSGFSVISGNMFQSTPARERATKGCRKRCLTCMFQSTPARERATTSEAKAEPQEQVSIHARSRAGDNTETGIGIISIRVSIHARSRAGDIMGFEIPDSL